MTICVYDPMRFLWKCDFEKLEFKVSYSYNFWIGAYDML